MSKIKNEGPCAYCPARVIANSGKNGYDCDPDLLGPNLANGGSPPINCPRGHTRESLLGRPPSVNFLLNNLFGKCRR